MNKIPFIGCINLKTRPDRLRKLLIQLKKLNIKNIHLLRPYKHKYGGRIGCFDSHLQLYKYCIQNNHKYALIFEDDIEIIHNNINNIMININYIINKYPNWYKIICHNCGFIKLKKKINNSIYEALCVGNVCYFISHTAMKLSLLKGITNNHLDIQHLIDFEKYHVFYIEPNLVKISPLGSDNDKWDNNIIVQIIQKLLDITTIHLIILHIFNKTINNNLFYNKIKNIYNKGNFKTNININNNKIHIINF